MELTTMMMISKHKNKIVSPQELPLWHGDIATHVPNLEGNPKIHWKGAPMPQKYLSQMIGFFRYAVAEWSSEAMLRLVYHIDKQDWQMICVPQYISTGMTVNEIKNLDEEQQAIRDAVFASVDGYVENGSSHSHCNTGAFQSGTDLANELQNPGVHLTLGRVNSTTPEIHGRVSFRGIMYPIIWKEWIEGFDNEEIQNEETLLFTVNDAELNTFPKEKWLKSCFKKPAPPSVSYSFAKSTTGKKYGWTYDDDDQYWQNQYWEQQQGKVQTFQSRHEGIDNESKAAIETQIANLVSISDTPKGIAAIKEFVWDKFLFPDYVNIRCEELFASTKTLSFALIDNEAKCNKYFLAKTLLPALAEHLTGGKTFSTESVLNDITELIDTYAQIVEQLADSTPSYTPILGDLLSAEHLGSLITMGINEIHMD
jgi:hypothetical protein